jgi:hypothetical protein
VGGPGKNLKRVKLMSLTTSLAELKRLLPLLRELYFSCQVDGLSLVASGPEADLQSNPWVHRKLAEYASYPLAAGSPLEARELPVAARRAVLEEQPDVVLLPSGSCLEGSLAPCLKEAGIGLYLVSGAPDEARLGSLLSELKNRLIASVPRPPKGQDPKALMEEHWPRLAERLAEIDGPCLLFGQQSLVKECRSRFPDLEIHEKPERDRYAFGLSLFCLSYADRPAEILQTFRTRCAGTLLLEPVNTQMVGARYTLRYGDYDNEFSFTPAEVDLKQTLGAPHTTEVWSRRKGRAGERPLPHPDGIHPLFATALQEASGCWTDRYALPQGKSLKIVFADSGNVAGSVIHHANAVNRNTSSRAWALALSAHPLIGPRQEDEHTFFLQGKGNAPSPQLERVLREADCFVFFEDDDERSQAWPFSLQPYVEGKSVLHLYIGYRVHRRTPELQREGRRILTPLPHILRMYPQACFYAGFPPQELIDLPLVPPRSQEDGVCRILHSPSVPHWTTARYPYHKDTEAFLLAARALKKRYGARLEVHQVGGWPQSEVLRARQACDITFNQLRGFHGLSGDEAMLLERPCVQAFDQSNVNRHREYWGLAPEFPWVATCREKLQETLACLIDDGQRRAEIGRASRAFMVKYFSPQKGILPLLYHCYETVQGS